MGFPGSIPIGAIVEPVTAQACPLEEAYFLFLSASTARRLAGTSAGIGAN
jgi:hypothetical protein